MEWTVGSHVRASYKTGIYVGELLEVKAEENKALIKVVSVIKHPQQGDLHNPKQGDGVFFHQRKALAQYEKVYAPLSTVKPYDGEIVDYKESLQVAFDKVLADVKDKDDSWSKQSVLQLLELKKDYFG
ncbi:sporulation phosphorelay system protein KapB [Bacillus alkalicellulosilyticus]|uniref:sporulation phosphorelay system protein KapB n=1 Tax=Alkalihalobacterium alkalicellulosilyticum TaxID=1912214 RepID=UPI000996E80D|nr:sporulation phosphorelay system protein KapB [Bacillus alkalicellulosilyticus]